MAHAPVQQSSAPEDDSHIIAEIERLKHLAETIGWNDANKVEARQLYEQWLHLDDVAADDVDDAPLHPLSEWIADIVDPLPLPEVETFVVYRNRIPRLPGGHIWREPKEWFEEAHDLLKHHFSEIKSCVPTAIPLADFDWDNAPKVENTYAQVKAEKLWGEYFNVNFAKKSKLHMKSVVLMTTLTTLLDMDDSFGRKY